MEIVKLKINKLKQYKKNAKLHPQEQIEQIKDSILEFGFNDPIAIWGDKNIIVEGHGRYLALKELGYEEVDCIRLDHMTDEERKAYTLVHNKLTMNTDFDYGLLNEEIGDIYEFIDMEKYGFELYDPIEEKQKNAETTQERVANILNLEKAQFDGVGKYDIPQLAPVYELPEIKEWIGFNYVLSDDEPEGKAVHFFIDDYQFMRLWNNPEAYVEKLKRYVCVTSPDFSPYGDMPHATQIFNHYRKHWVGAFLQANGVTVIPTIRCSSDERSLEWYLDGEPKNGIVIVSSMWTKENRSDEEREFDEKSIKGLVDGLHPSKIFIYGRQEKDIERLYDGEIEYIQSFTEKRWGAKNGNEEIT